MQRRLIGGRDVHKEVQRRIQRGCGFEIPCSRIQKHREGRRGQIERVGGNVPPCLCSHVRILDNLRLKLEFSDALHRSNKWPHYIINGAPDVPSDCVVVWVSVQQRKADAIFWVRFHRAGCGDNDLSSVGFIEQHIGCKVCCRQLPQVHHYGVVHFRCIRNPQPASTHVHCGDIAFADSAGSCIRHHHNAQVEGARVVLRRQNVVQLSKRKGCIEDFLAVIRHHCGARDGRQPSVAVGIREAMGRRESSAKRHSQLNVTLIRERPSMNSDVDASRYNRWRKLQQLLNLVVWKWSTICLGGPSPEGNANTRNDEQSESEREQATSVCFIHFD
eukprot:Opistho-2@49137